MPLDYLRDSNVDLENMLEKLGIPKKKDFLMQEPLEIEFKEQSGEMLIALITTGQTNPSSLNLCGVDFLPLVEDRFDARLDILEATYVFTNRVTDWNKHVFGNIFHSKRHILARLSGIQKSNACPFSIFLQELEAKLQHDFYTILKIEEDFWKLISRISWLSEGNANTKFFHISTLNRRRRNMIMSFKDEVGTTVRIPRTLKTIINYFTKIYTTEHHNSVLNRIHITDSTNILNTREQDTIDSTFRLSEIKCALFFFKAMKAPGPDNLHPFFYKKY
ncbi:PREDICTED: uncharacterized protein LOC109235058 [Nicotiana attenuata]|uniref:uncharacterized protein LOC109235058 n=1 Tax=Nicotiana attenuata TaxID=49451 RepID=UPI000904F2E7|nr:PREDICTED: uncharacterized protein LOC109235058 [Nicotiana attenuata]